MVLEQASRKKVIWGDDPCADEPAFRVATVHRDNRQGDPIMKKLGMFGIIAGAALLTVAPFSLQWSQDEVSLSLNSVNARIIPGVHRRVYRRTYRRPAYAVTAAGYGYGSYYGYGSPYYSSYYAPQPYSTSHSRKAPRAPRKAPRAYYPLALSPIPLQLLPATLCERTLLRSKHALAKVPQ